MLAGWSPEQSAHCPGMRVHEKSHQDSSGAVQCSAGNLPVKHVGPVQEDAFALVAGIQHGSRKELALAPANVHDHPCVAPVESAAQGVLTTLQAVLREVGHRLVELLGKVGIGLVLTVLQTAEPAAGQQGRHRQKV